MNGGDYERWVTGLRAWRDDPTTDLSTLPPLTSASFTPATYARLFTHLQQALETMLAAWGKRLQKAFDEASGDPHLIGRALVDLRAELARRVQLSRLPGWPPEIAADLEAGASRDIHDLQAQLERNVEKQDGRTGSDRATTEALLRVLRENRLTAILDPGFDLERLFAARIETAPTRRLASTESVAPPVEAPQDSPLSPRPFRRIVIDS